MLTRVSDTAMVRLPDGARLWTASESLLTALPRVTRTVLAGAGHAPWAERGRHPPPAHRRPAARTARLTGLSPGAGGKPAVISRARCGAGPGSASLNPAGALPPDHAE
jgi:hypothetical protein